MMMRMIVSAVAILAVSACTFGPIEPTMISGDNISTEHGEARITFALQGAQKYCTSQGKGVQHMSTNCGYRCISTFRCTPIN